ncbi:MAG TPA: twin-arginine translocase TatA/TatE family subunit [Pyrinomonadaceae bacterium]
MFYPLFVIGGLGMQELIIVLIILLLLFGSTRLPQLAKGMGKSIREFKKGINDGEDDSELEAGRERERLRAADSARLRDEELASDRATLDKPRS